MVEKISAANLYWQDENYSFLNHTNLSQSPKETCSRDGHKKTTFRHSSLFFLKRETSLVICMENNK
jgi:hypothetical protein